MSSLGINIGNRILRKKRKSFDRPTQVHNFVTASSAYIIFDTSVANSLQVIKPFENFLASEKINCKVIGFVQDKEVPAEMLFRDKYEFITKNDINWYKKPKGELVDSFLQSEPDILFDFTLNSLLEVKYLVQLSKASFKVGCFTEEDNDFDLMINPGGRCELDYFVEQVKHYVNMLNPS